MKVQLNTGSIIEINRPQANLGSIVTAKKLQTNIDGSIIDLWLPRGTTIDHSTPVTVVNANYDTSGNGGRKLVRLSNGWLVCVVYIDAATGYIFYKSTDNGATWSQLCYQDVVSGNQPYYAIASVGTIVHFIFTYDVTGSGAVKYSEFDATTQTNVKLSETNIDSSQTDAKAGCSIAVDSFGNLHAAWSSKNATYPNSFNIRYSKSLDGGVTWATPEQVTTTNNTAINIMSPSIVVSQGSPKIYGRWVSTSSNQNQIYQYTYNGTSWDSTRVYSNMGYEQSNPCAVVDSNGDIHVTWQGYDSTDTSKYNIRYSKSADDGATWSAMEKLTTGSSVDRKAPSITADSNNVPYIVYDDNGTLKWIKYSGSWSSPETIATGTNPSVTEDITTFTKPVTLFDGGSDVKFYGVWTT